MESGEERGWQQVVGEWLKSNGRSQAWLCRQARLSETHFSHQMHERKTITDRALRSIEEVMELESETLVELKRATVGGDVC